MSYGLVWSSLMFIRFSRLTIIAHQKQCPADLKEGISSLIFTAPRCSDIPELMVIKDVFEKKNGKDFVSAATDL